MSIAQIGTMIMHLLNRTILTGWYASHVYRIGFRAKVHNCWIEFQRCPRWRWVFAIIRNVDENMINSAPGLIINCTLIHRKVWFVKYQLKNVVGGLFFIPENWDIFRNIGSNPWNCLWTNHIDFDHETVIKNPWIIQDVASSKVTINEQMADEKCQFAIIYHNWCNEVRHCYSVWWTR